MNERRRSECAKAATVESIRERNPIQPGLPSVAGKRPMRQRAGGTRRRAAQMPVFRSLLSCRLDARPAHSLAMPGHCSRCRFGSFSIVCPRNSVVRNCAIRTRWSRSIRRTLLPPGPLRVVGGIGIPLRIANRTSNPPGNSASTTPCIRGQPARRALIAACGHKNFDTFPRPSRPRLRRQ